MEYPKNQHLFNAIRDITGFTPLESDMRQILIAAEKDNPCSPPDEGAFAEWCNTEEWDIIEYTETDEAIWMKKAGENDFGDVKTTKQLIQLFTDQRK